MQIPTRESHNDGQSNTLDGLSKIFDEFEQVLRSLGISITVGSQLEAACLSVYELSESHRNSSLRNRCQDTRQFYIDAFGVWTFITKIIRLHDKPGFAQFRPHLCLLNKGT